MRVPSSAEPACAGAVELWIRRAPERARGEGAATVVSAPLSAAADASDGGGADLRLTLYALVTRAEREAARYWRGGFRCGAQQPNSLTA